MKATGTIVGILIFVAAGYWVKTAFRYTITAATTGQDTGCLHLLGSTTRDEEHFTYIVGSVRNDCSRKFSNVTIAFKIDRTSSDTKTFHSDAPILAYTRDLKPGETQQFKTQYHISRNSTYHFDKITGF